MSHILTVFRGALIGLANIIPGVSGGTFALVLGLYERLLAAIGSFGARTLQVVWGLLGGPGKPERRAAFVQEWRRTDAAWLLLLALGAGLAILGSSRLIAWLLDEHLAPTLAYFIGLILPSILVPFALLERRSWREALSCLAGTAGIVGLTFLPHAESGAGLGWLGLLLAGAIAISAMILPGVSGSFMLMVMGYYETILDAINQFDLVTLGVFAVGCLAGLIGFVRLLNLLLRKFHATTMAFLIGLILGSLWVLWPFKQIAPGAKIITGVNVLPARLDLELAWVAGALVLGLVCSAGVMWLGRDLKRSVAAGAAR